MVTRRKFLGSSLKASAIVATGAALDGCSGGNKAGDYKSENTPFIRIPGHISTDGVAGLLFSMIGYESGYPVRIVVRLPKKELLDEKSYCRLIPLSGNENEQKSECKYWGEIWRSHWWVCEFPASAERGEWSVEIVSKGECVLRDCGLKIEKNILWDKTVHLTAADMLERRVHFTKVGAGWQDAGTLWVENCSHSPMIVALTEMLELPEGRIENALKERICKQITVGCDYLVMLQKKAAELGFPAGAMSHDLHGHEKDILPNDAMKAVIALAAASRTLPASFSEKKELYRKTAELTYRWLTETAKPMGDYGLSLFQRGLPAGTVVPDDEWQTRDLVSLCWAALELSLLRHEGSKEDAIAYAGKIMARQITEEKNESGFWGHFLEYDSLPHSEKSWIHGIVNNQFGADIGGIYPNYLMPLIRMTKVWSDHKDAAAWKETLRKFAYGYLIPACRTNPFLIVPQGIFGSEGPVWFCGTFHGTNTIYGYTAALAFELSEMFNEPALKDIAYGNLQWIAGLNGGITNENLQACVVYSTDLPAGLALPASMMCGVGKRWAGTWFQTRGSICNGFSTGKQFVYDTAPLKANDGPFSFTDEDWIPHGAAWLTGLMKLK